MNRHLLFIVSEFNVVQFHYVQKQALKSRKEPVHLEEHRNIQQFPVYRNNTRMLEEQKCLSGQLRE